MNTSPFSRPTPKEEEKTLLARLEPVLVAGYFLLFTILFTWPLASRLLVEIPRSTQPADPMHILYGLTTGARNILHNPLGFFEATFFYPYPHSLSFLDQIFALCLLAAPVDLISGNMILGYNVVWILTFVLAGSGAYLLVHDLTGSRIAGLLAGVLFAFYPYRFHSAGILHVVGMMWIPFALWALHRWVHSEEKRYLAGFAGFSLAQFLSSGYTGVFLVLATGLYFLVLFFSDRRFIFDLLWRQRWVITLTGLIGFMILTPFISPTLYNVQNHLGMDNRTLGESGIWSARPADLIAPAPESLLRFLDLGPDLVRQPLFPGLVAVVLAGLWLAARAWRGHPRRPEMIFYAVLAGAALILAFGPFFQVGDVRVPLPFALGYYVIPGASFIRAPVRFMVLTSLGVAVLAGGGWLVVRELIRSKLVAAAVGVAVVGLSLTELYPGPMALLNPLPEGLPPAYERIRQNPRPVIILELPMPADEQEEIFAHTTYQLYSLIHGKRLVNGVGAVVPPITREVRQVMQRFPEDDAVETLQNLGVGYVFVHTDLMPVEKLQPLREAVKESKKLTWIQEEDGIWVVEVVPIQLKG